MSRVKCKFCLKLFIFFCVKSYICCVQRNFVPHASPISSMRNRLKKMPLTLCISFVKLFALIKSICYNV